MPSGRRAVRLRIHASASVLLAVMVATVPFAESPAPVHAQRYAMGTMFNIVVYHGSSAHAARAIEAAFAEVTRLDGLMSNFNPESDLSALVRQARLGPVQVVPSLYEIIERSTAVSRLTGGKFDVTIAPLLRVFKEANADGRQPDAAEISAARQCVGYAAIETHPPDRIRFTSSCLDIDLGGIGKGYAVERALFVLKSAGIEDAVVNAGGSSIGAIGAQPGHSGWPVHVGGDTPPGRTIELRNMSIATSRQASAMPGDEVFSSRQILDPHLGTPAQSGTTVSIVAADATLADALSTTLVMLTIAEGRALLARVPGVSALWFSPGGALEWAHDGPALQPRRQP